MATTASLEALQSDEQARVLDTVQQLRTCGLDSFLPLPQLVVCGDQSAGKSSVLEALTEIPFPRSDNLCTRFATEINLRRTTEDRLTLKLIPDAGRPASEQERVKAFSESITDLQELPTIMAKAMEVMGVGEGASKAFTKDVLSIDIEGPSRPQLSLVDLPGLIENATKGVTEEDVRMVAEMTDHYISQSRTICLAVLSATNDYSNQKIVTKVRKVDPKGERTLGIITKSDLLPGGSGSEKAYINLAQNTDIFFELGWHVLKNRKFEEMDFSFEERNASEVQYFMDSNFKCLPKDNVGIDSLRTRLSQLLFSHVKQELPKLQSDLDVKLAETRQQLDRLGISRASAQDCRQFLIQLSQDCHIVAKAAVDGHYQDNYFVAQTDKEFSVDSRLSIRRLRAVIQKLNEDFNTAFRESAHTYTIVEAADVEELEAKIKQIALARPRPWVLPKVMQRDEALGWVQKALIQNRGRELSGNFNPLVVGELFWEQSNKWKDLAEHHVTWVAKTCTTFLKDLFSAEFPSDILLRVWNSHIQDVLKLREEQAMAELDRIMEDVQAYPINYNHYYTDVVKKGREKRMEASNEDKPDVERHGCEEALDCLLAIYKVQQKTFIANVVTQIIERHIVRGLEKIFSPVMVNKLSDDDVMGIAAEPTAGQRQRSFLQARQVKLDEFRKILKGVMNLAI
ncbi:dynamin family protein-like protein [Venturia nashicola]|nr:dynamin family protein-like protein [Venturia nashicola]